MSMLWSITIIAIVITWMAAIIKPHTYQKGKYITMPMRRRWKTFNTSFCRLKQIGILFIASLIINAFFPPFTYIYMFALIALAVDDYISDEDNFKKFKDAVRNKIKWKMELPKPVPVGGKTG